MYNGQNLGYAILALILAFAAMGLARLANTRQADRIFVLLKQFVTGIGLPIAAIAITGFSMLPFLIIVVADSNMSLDNKGNAAIIYVLSFIGSVVFAVIRFRQINEKKRRTTTPDH